MIKFDKEKIISELSLAEKAAFLTGKDFWQTRDLPEFGVPSIFLSDGPHGLRKQAAAADHLGLNASIPSTCFPTAAAMANSWNEELGEELGRALGEEAAAQNVNVVLGPGACQKRNPRCGRNFEYFSEDPYLAGKMAAAYIRGIQNNGTAACVKHYACNNQEERRMVSDSVVDERTLRELYLTAFEIAVKEGGVKTIMSSYNKINGTFASENGHVLNEILRGEWGFKGVIVSDWGGMNDRPAAVKVGAELEMPACAYGAEDVVKAVESGELGIEDVDACVRRLLTLIEEVSEGEKGGEFSVEKHHALARRCAEDSIVLLKNDGVLPVAAGVKVALVGDFAETPRYQGAGSSVVNPTALDCAKDAIASCNFSYVGYEKGFDRYGKNKKGLRKKAVKLAAQSDVVLLFLGLDEVTEAEGLDRNDIAIPENQLLLLDALIETGKKVAVVLSCGSAVETERLKKADAIIYACLSGQAGAAAVLDVISGKVNPSGKMAETFPVRYEDCPTANYFPGKQMTVEYREGPFIGYRYYGTAGVPVSYPFGFGLSYTTFKYSGLKIGENGVTFEITNSGAYDGAEIAQLYVGKSDSSVFRPVKELKGFKKVFIKAGKSVKVEIPFDDKTFRYFNVKTNRWEVEGGEYSIMIAASSEDVRLTGAVNVKGSTDVVPYDREKLASYYGGDIKSVGDEEFAALLGRDIPESGYNFYKKNRMVIGENSTVSDLRYSKRWVGRLFSSAIRFAIKFCRAFGMKTKANTLVMGVLHQPVRGIAKFGGLGRRKMEALLLMFNGHFFKGLHRFMTKEKKKGEQSK